MFQDVNEGDSLTLRGVDTYLESPVLNLDHALAVVAALQIGVVEGEGSLVHDADTVSRLLLWSGLACKQR